MMTRIVGHNHIVLTAHDSPRCTHEIVVKGVRIFGVDSPDAADVEPFIMWNTSQGPISVASAREFATALLEACRLGEGMQRPR